LSVAFIDRIMALGNPAPLGLFAFGMTTLMLMYVEMGWAEKDFEVKISGVAVFLGGLGQILVGIFELVKGSSFSFAVFISYGAFWLSWAIVYIVGSQEGSSFGDASYQNGMTLFFIQWGVLTSFFFVITLRKNMCLIVVFGLLVLTFFLLAAANATGKVAVRKAAGYVGFLTAVGAMYTGLAELVNEEWGRLVLPGLHPIHTPERTVISKDGIMKLISYDKKTNSLFLQFSGLQITRTEHVEAIREAVTTSIVDAGAPSDKVHVVVDYKNVTIGKDVEDRYWAMAHALEREYYLSVRRFYVSSFGTTIDNNHQVRSSRALSIRQTQVVDTDRKTESANSSS
jgi:uncharacterized protein